MGKARILGRDAYISAVAGNTVVELGEIDKFSAKKLDELKKSQPLGEFAPTSNVVHMGWELSFEGGKVDWKLGQMIHAQDQQINSGGRSPYFQIKQVIKYYDGKVETFVYDNVSIYGYELDMGGSTDELTEKVSAFAGNRRLVTASTTPDVTATANGVISGIADALSTLPEKPVVKAQLLS